MTNPDYYTIEQQKGVGMWPLSFLPAYGMIPYINRMKINPVQGLELGVLKGENAFVLLESCPNLHLTGVDFYTAHTDGELVRTQEEMDIFEKVAQENLAKFMVPGEERFLPVKADALKLEPTPDSQYDFILLDTIQTTEQVQKELELYYPELKPGGLMFVHDVHMTSVMVAIKEFRNANKIRTPLNTSKNFVGFWQK